MELISRICVPNDEFSILGGGDEVPSVRGPMHGVNLGKMAFKSATGLHGDSR